MTESAENITEEPQSARGELGSRDTGSDEPGAGTVDRPGGAIDDDAVHPLSDPDDDAIYAGTGELPPQDTGSAVPPYQGRQHNQSQSQN